jgi:hypothetical protein
MATIGKTSNGAYVLDKYNTHQDIPQLVLRETISKIVVGEFPWQVATVEFTTPVGHTIVVPTNPSSDIIFAQKPANKFLSRFVKNSEPQPTCFVTVEIKKIPNINEWILMNSYFGSGRQPEINHLDGSLVAESQIKFWTSHAYTWGYVAVVPATVTATSPWEF